jgi:bifunctional enzyme CysN/CysC
MTQRLTIEDFLERYENRELLRFLTCGSVDDGKSTLIGRLLHDSASVYEDQLEAARRDSKKRDIDEEIDYSLLVDGLSAEREQGITIDVAYRYFSTPKRKFIIADTPGHEQYTRNMATGASTCDLAIILVDAREGVLPQTRRHAFIATLLGIRHLVLAINKMDLVGYDETRYLEIREEFSDFASKLQANDLEFIPVSALRGDNVVHRSERMPWYEGRPLLDYLETVHIAGDRNLIDLRLPVQYVVRSGEDFRGYAGTIASGVLRRNDEVMVLPSLRRTRVATISDFGGDLDEAFAPMAVTITLADDIDVSRGDMLVAPNNVPHVTNDFEAMLVWMAEEPLAPGGQYLLKHSTVQAPATVTAVRYRIDVNTLRRADAESLGLNDIGRIRVESPRRLAFDAYNRNRGTGAFVLIDRISNATVASGMILDREPSEALTSRHIPPDAGTNLKPHESSVTFAERTERSGCEPFVVWLTGLPRSGKSSIAFALERALFDQGLPVHVIDGENLRLGVSSDLGFAQVDRAEAARRAAEIAKITAGAGLITLVALVTPLEADRRAARDIVGGDRFIEIFCDSPLEVCEARDTEGLFARGRSGDLENVTGIDLPYEQPREVDLVLDTAGVGVDDNVRRVLELLRGRKLLN